MSVRDKEAKFVELAEKRVNKALESLRLVGNLANRANYDYSPEDAKKIINALQAELSTVRGKFLSEHSGQDKKFRLK